MRKKKRSPHLYVYTPLGTSEQRVDWQRCRWPEAARATTGVTFAQCTLAPATEVNGVKLCARHANLVSAFRLGAMLKAKEEK